MKKYKPLDRHHDDLIPNSLWSFYSPKIKWRLRRDLSKQVSAGTEYIKFMIVEEIGGGK